MKTADLRPRKDHRGNWSMETLETVNGVTWQITTMKRHSGALTTTAQETISAENGVVAFELCASKNITLVSEKVRVTEKAVRAQFFKALSLFEDNEVVKGKKNTKKEDLVIGRIFFFWSLESDQNGLAIYNISVNDFGTTYHYVNTKTLALGTTDRIKPIAEKFGIGYYYLEDEFIDIDKLNNMVIDAKLKEKKYQEQKAIEEKARQEQQNRDIAKGKKLVNIPSWAKCVIVADLYQNDSDSMTDYFSTSVIDTVYLGFSKSTRNNMNELKEHALLFGETKNFVDEENYEQTDGGSYAPYYYLGSSRWGGWKVNKRKYFDLSNEQHKSKLFEAVGKGKFVNSSFLKNRAEEKPTNSEIVNGDGVTLVDYSEKAFAIIGDTNSISVLLKQLGGRFNRNLKCGAGWIFPKTKLDLVKTNITNLQFEAL